MVALGPADRLVDLREELIASRDVFVTHGTRPKGFNDLSPFAKLGDVVAEEGYESGASHGVEFSVLGLWSLMPEDVRAELGQGGRKTMSGRTQTAAHPRG